MKLARQYLQSLLNAKKLLIFAFLASFALYIYAPFAMVFLKSVGKDWFGKLRVPPTLTLDWYSWAWTVGHVPEITKNTLIIAAMAVAASTLIGIPTGWALGRRSIPGKELLMAIILLAVLQTIPGELYEAAKVDGANPWQRFRHITLPHLIPTILFLLLLRTIWMSNHIDVIFIMTRGGPGFSNYTEAVYSFMLTSRFEIGYSSAVAVVLAIILVAASALYVRHLARTVLA